MNKDIYVDLDGQQVGPYDLAELQALVLSGTITPEHLCARPGAETWVRVAEMLPPVLNDATSAGAAAGPKTTRAAVAWVQKRAAGFLVRDERVLEVAAQTIGIAYDGVIVTDRRILMLWAKLGGLKVTFRDWLWVDVVDVHVEDNVIGATITVQALNGTGSVSRLDKEEARAVYRVAQEMEVTARQSRWQHKIEALKAGSAVFQANQPPRI